MLEARLELAQYCYTSAPEYAIIKITTGDGMTYDATKDDYEYFPELSLEQNQENLEARWRYLYQWAKDNWGHSCHAAGAEARAQYLESCPDDEETLQTIDENDGWAWVESLLEDYGMVDIMNSWIERGSMYPSESTYGANGYEWMLDAVGYDIPGTVFYVQEWLENPYTFYERKDDIRALLAKEGWV